MKKNSYDVIVIGSGAGGSVLAHELAKQGKKILIVEKGPVFSENCSGNFFRSVLRFYWKAGLGQSIEGTKIYRAFVVGGTSVFSCGNMVRSRVLEETLASHGIILGDEFSEAEKEINVKASKVGASGARAVMNAAKRLGYNMYPMPKGFNENMHCDLCGNCVASCHLGAKWDARAYIVKALKQGAELRSFTTIDRVLFNSVQSVIGVQLVDGKIIRGDKIILAAGGIGTPIILQNSNISAGNGLFIDPFEITCGIAPDNLSQMKSPSMSTVIDEFHNKEGFILSPFVDHWSQMLIFCDLWWDIVHWFPSPRVLSIMTKISDTRSGRVFLNGKISKSLIEEDHLRLQKGTEISRNILQEAGVDPSTIITTTRRARGAHPGGTAAIGEVVNNNLEVKGCKGLYVCDCSVFPVAPGMPPILTIVALAKWLAKELTG